LYLKEYIKDAWSHERQNYEFFVGAFASLHTLPLCVNWPPHHSHFLLRLRY